MISDPLPYHYKYPRPSVTTDCVIFGLDKYGVRVLLIRRSNDPCRGAWAFPGGFLEMEESAEAGALRELSEETGLQGAPIRQFHTFSDPQRDPRGRVITIAYYAVVRISDIQAADDAAEARWFVLDEVPTLAFDHAEMLQRAIEALRRDLCYGPTDLGMLPDHITPEDLQILRRTIEALPKTTENPISKP